MPDTLLSQLANHSERLKTIPDELALAVLQLPDDRVPDLLRITNRLRQSVFGKRVRLCSIVNARSGLCGEDCTFCAQATCYRDAPREIYPMLQTERISDAHAMASDNPVSFFSIVTSGGALSDKDIETALASIRSREGGANYCASLGMVDIYTLRKLKQAGLVRYHHNLETARSFYPKICTTHNWQQRIEVVRAAHQAGLEVCSGGILGLGESLEQRVELARSLADEKVEGIPLNFLIPVPGTPLQELEIIPPLDALRAIAMFRLTNPHADLRIAGGRQHLGPMQSMIFYAGCTGMMIGDLLTTPGASIDDDIRMVRDLGLEPMVE